MHVFMLYMQGKLSIDIPRVADRIWNPIRIRRVQKQLDLYLKKPREINMTI